MAIVFHRRHADEHGAVLDAGAGGVVLPDPGRATGVAWMLGIGRFGGIAGSYLVAELSRRQLAFAEIFMVVAIPGAIAAVALVIKQFVHPEGKIPVSRA